MKTLYLYDLLRQTNPVKALSLTIGNPYLVIGVETHTYYDDYYEEEKWCDEYDVNKLERFKAQVKILGTVKNPRYLKEEGHMLQVAIVTFMGD